MWNVLIFNMISVCQKKESNFFHKWNWLQKTMTKQTGIYCESMGTEISTAGKKFVTLSFSFASDPPEPFSFSPSPTGLGVVRQHESRKRSQTLRPCQTPVCQATSTPAEMIATCSWPAMGRCSAGLRNSGHTGTQDLWVIASKTETKWAKAATSLHWCDLWCLLPGS